MPSILARLSVSPQAYAEILQTYSTERKYILEILGGKCWFCGTTEKLSLHHIVFARIGGPSAIYNLIPVCLGKRGDHWQENSRSYQWLKVHDVYVMAAQSGTISFEALCRFTSWEIYKDVLVPAKPLDILWPAYYPDPLSISPELT